MRCVKIIPSMLNGSIRIPPSKSMAHRAVICGALSKGLSNIFNIDYSDDITATIEGMRTLGAEIIEENNCLSVCGEGFLENKNSDFKIIDCIESGSTIRFLIPVALIKENRVIFKGRGNLGQRPLEPYFEIFEKQNIKYEKEKDKLNLKIEGRLKPGEFKIKGNISSQFISGLLFALPLLCGNSKIVITANLESKGYIDLTLDILNKFGIVIENNDYREFFIEGNQKYSPQNYTVEGDYSQAAFFLVAGALGSNIKCEGLNINSLQGDRAILDIIRNMDGKVEINDKFVQAYGTKTRGTIIDGSQFPDIVPILAVLASLSCGTTKIINSKRLRIKECDRLKAICTELNKLGADIKEMEDGLIINGKETLNGGMVDSWNDHRIVMALAIASTRCINPVIITNSGAVKKSYPGFWNDFKNLGGKIDEWNMG